jgi:very-short-patch-repair endonuclease
MASRWTAQAFYLLVLAYSRGNPDARSKARALRQEMNKEELKELGKELRDHRFDPKKVSI